MTSHDTMSAKRTLSKIELDGCRNSGDDGIPGCCQCEIECPDRECVFGNASGCVKQMACCESCPRLVINNRGEIEIPLFQME